MLQLNYLASIHNVTGGVFRSVNMMTSQLLELGQLNEKKLAEGSVKMRVWSRQPSAA